MSITMIILIFYEINRRISRKKNKVIFIRIYKYDTPNSET